MSKYILFNYLADFNINDDDVHILKCIWQMFLNLLDLILTWRKYLKWNLSLNLDLS